MPIKYVTTRTDTQSINSSEAILKGLGNDGGLYIPTEIPNVSIQELKAMVDLTYQDKAKAILGKYLNNFTIDEISYCVDKAYNNHTFTDKSITPIRIIDDKCAILELYHGPTSAFKDIALQILPHLLTTSARKNGDNRTYVILVATSGDTGKAALEGFKNVEKTKILVFYPNDGVSLVQKLQMTTQEGSNVKVVSVEGNFDDTQTEVKKLFRDKKLIAELEQSNYTFSSANSINWGRLAPQIVYYFSSYCDLVKFGAINFGDKINFTVPTGNFGNILASYYAKEMGLPINKLICASNTNDVLKDFIKTGIYNKNRNFYKTISPSMDILISSNLERLLFTLSNHDKTLITSLMRDLKEKGKYKVNSDIMAKISHVLSVESSNDKETIETIAKVYKSFNYLIDTHTAVAYNVYEKYLEESGDTTFNIVVSTASPYKFVKSIAKAILPGFEKFNEMELFKEINKATRIPVPKELSNLEFRNIKFKKNINKNLMKKILMEYLKITKDKI